MSPARRVVLTAAAAPLYAIGWVAAIVWALMLWVAMAAAVGFEDGSRLMRPQQEP